MPLAYDPLKTAVQNMVALVHHTFPDTIDLVTENTVSFAATVRGDDPLKNSNVTITGTTATLTGSKALSYNRVVVPSADVTLAAGSSIDEYITSAGLDFEVTHAPHETKAFTHVVTVVSTSLTHVGSWEVYIPSSELEDWVTGTELNGFVEPV